MRNLLSNGSINPLLTIPCRYDKNIDGAKEKADGQNAKKKKSDVQMFYALFLLLQLFCGFDIFFK